MIYAFAILLIVADHLLFRWAVDRSFVRVGNRIEARIESERQA